MKLLLTILLALHFTSNAQQYRPEVFFREDFKETSAHTPITQDHVKNSKLLISLYGKGAKLIKKSHHDKPYDDPYYVWSGLCEDNWAVTLKHKSKYVDLTKQSKIRWRSKQSGFRQLYIILMLNDETWLISDVFSSFSKDWKISEFNIQDIRWRSLNIETITEKKWVKNPNLSKVEEIGFTDLMIGGGSIASSRLDWIEVYGYSVDK